MKMFLLLLLFSVFVSLCLGEPTPFTFCSSNTYPPPHFVKIGDCVSSPCSFDRCSHVTVNINYTYPADVTWPVLRITYKSIDYPILPNVVLYYNSCWFGPCPVTAGQTVYYTYNQWIHPLVPVGDFVMKAEVLGNGGVVLFCGSIQGNIIYKPCFAIL